jgi:serine/threonine protein kinase
MNIFLVFQPERFSPAGYDVRSDLWSLGVSLFELACQRSPFGDEHSNEFDFLIAVTTQGQARTVLLFFFLL